MSEIIRELFDGEIQPEEHFYFFDDFEIIENELNENFNSKQKELFESYKIARRNHEREIAFFNFKYGFKTASKLVFESLH
jgi:hypothetical protein